MALHGYHPCYSIKFTWTTHDRPQTAEWLKFLQQAQEDLQFHIKLEQETQEKYFIQNAIPQPDFVVGNLVWLVQKYITATQPSNKLDIKKLSLSRIHPAFH
ncbi:hypothetical protein BGZ76_005903, partial [Entomortierella beljakovae]